MGGIQTVPYVWKSGYGLFLIETVEKMCRLGQNTTFPQDTTTVATPFQTPDLCGNGK